MTTTTHSKKRLIAAIELSNSKWLLGFDNGAKVRRKSLRAGDRAGLLAEIAKAKQKLGYEEHERVLFCYEAGRDGFWIHRWLETERIECLVVDPASIEVNRRRRRAKTDRLDVEGLLRHLRRYLNGEARVWSVLHVPDEKAEDGMRLHREMERLKKERNAHTNRIKGLLKLHGISVTGRLNALGGVLGDLRKWDGKALAPELMAEIRRELGRVALVDEQLAELEKSKQRLVEQPVSNADRQIADLLRLKGVGPVSAWILAKEFFGWREFRNRREVASLAGLTPTPYDSGNSRREQGISKAGNRRVRHVMVELAWTWMRYQPESAITHWYIERFAGGSRRMRRVGIVAVARKLLIALWRYVEFGEVPEGAIVKS